METMMTMTTTAGTTGMAWTRVWRARPGRRREAGSRGRSLGSAQTACTLLLMAALAGGVQPVHAQPKSPVEIPLSLHGNRMVVPATSEDGTSLRFLVSTGSAVTVLSESGAARIGGGGTEMGGIPINMEGAVTVPDSDLTVDGVVMDGLVSNNTLYDFDVLFDVPGGRLVLKPFGRMVTWPGMALSEPVPLRVYHGVVLALDVKVNGSPYPAMLELGSPSLLANTAVLEETGIGNGTADLTLGAVVLNGLPIERSDHPVIGRFSPNGDGFVLVGTPPALDCAMAVSWVHRELRTCVR